MSSLEIYDPLREEWFTAIADVEHDLAIAIGKAFDVLIMWRVVEKPQKSDRKIVAFRR